MSLTSWHSYRLCTACAKGGNVMALVESDVLVERVIFDYHPIKVIFDVLSLHSILYLFTKANETRLKQLCPLVTLFLSFRLLLLVRLDDCNSLLKWCHLGGVKRNFLYMVVIFRFVHNHQLRQDVGSI